MLSVAIAKRKQNYQVDLAALMAICETNYWRLQKLLLPEFPKFSCGDVFVFSLPSPNRMDERHLRLHIVERCPYTTTLELSEIVTDDAVSRWGLSPQLTVRVYHDAKSAEVISFQKQRNFFGRYEYPNPQMRQQDEKFQLNSLLAEWLHHCLQFGYRSDYSSVCEHDSTVDDLLPLLK